MTTMKKPVAATTGYQLRPKSRNHFFNRENTESFDINAIKSNFDAIAYAEQVTGCTAAAPDGKGFRKLIGGHLGGLTVSPTGFYHHTEEVGGDVLDLVAWLRFGTLCDKLSADQFRNVLAEAAAFAGEHGRTIRPALPPSSLSGHREAESGKPTAVPVSDWKRITTYDYHDENGMLLFHVDRLERHVRRADDLNRPVREKRFIQRPAGVERAFTGCMKDVRRVLYRLPDVIQAVEYGRPVILVEGEKDADTYNSYLLRGTTNHAVATCSPGGAGKWETYGSDYVETLHGADVVIDGDLDAPGIAHARTIAESLRGVALRVRIVKGLRQAVEEVQQ